MGLEGDFLRAESLSTSPPLPLPFAGRSVRRDGDLGGLQIGVEIIDFFFRLDEIRAFAASPCDDDDDDDSRFAREDLDFEWAFCEPDVEPS